MAFTVEDGTGLIAANSYASVSEADAYFADMGNQTWAAVLNADKQSALIRASRALDGMYVLRWPGLRVKIEQGLAWPRYDALDADGEEIASDSVPPAVKNATCEAALIEAGESGALSESLDRGGQLIEKTVGSITKKWAPGAPASTVYRTIAQAISRIIPSGGNLRLKRA